MVSFVVQPRHLDILPYILVNAMPVLASALPLSRFLTSAIFYCTAMFLILSCHLCSNCGTDAVGYGVQSQCWNPAPGKCIQSLQLRLTSPSPEGIIETSVFGCLCEDFLSFSAKHLHLDHLIHKLSHPPLTVANFNPLHTALLRSNQLNDAS